MITDDAVNHPPHYGGDTTYEVIKVLEAWGLDQDAYLFNAVKYEARAGKKDPARELEDLEKARWYLDRKIAKLRAEQQPPYQPTESGYSPDPGSIWRDFVANKLTSAS